MNPAHYNTRFHCECGAAFDPKACITACKLCREPSLDSRHPCPNCGGEATFMVFSKEEREKFLEGVYKDPVNINFLDELGFNKNDAKTIERCMNAMGPVTSYWKAAQALNRQLTQLRANVILKRDTGLTMMEAGTAIHDAQKQMDKYLEERAIILRKLIEVEEEIQTCIRTKTHAEQVYAQYLCERHNA